MSKLSEILAFLESNHLNPDHFQIEVRPDGVSRINMWKSDVDDNPALAKSLQNAKRVFGPLKQASPGDSCIEATTTLSTSDHCVEFTLFGAMKCEAITEEIELTEKEREAELARIERRTSELNAESELISKGIKKVTRYKCSAA